MLRAKLLRPRDSPVFHVFGANTGVGKTVASAGLLRRASLPPSSLRVSYLKPVQTGFPSDSDARLVQSLAPRATVAQLFAYREAVGPHLAVQLENSGAGSSPPVIPSDDQVRQRIDAHLVAHDSASQSASLLLVETAGGVLSPGIANTALQVDVLRPFRFPVLLVGDARLGGISTTLSAYESLRLRGMDVASICFFSDNGALDNARAVERHVDATTRVVSLDGIPAEGALGPWMDEREGQFGELLSSLLAFHGAQVDAREKLAASTRETVWWPFTQHRTVRNVMSIDSAYGDYYVGQVCDETNAPVVNNAPQHVYDACGSWWTQGVGHGNPTMDIAYAAGRYGHLIFPEVAHAPATALAERALRLAGGAWASRVFFSDNGSAAIEIALKMAMQLYARRRGLSPSDAVDFETVALSNSYHGDTLGAMNISSPTAFNKSFKWYKGSSLWLDAPTFSLRDGLYHVVQPDDGAATALGATFESVHSSERDTSPLADAYARRIDAALDGALAAGRHLAALVMEPVVHGANGMEGVDPLFQRLLIRACRRRGIVIILDEIFVGMYRLGPASAALAYLRESPDIATFAKLLSGGSLSIALTLASADVFDSFLGEAKREALLHGHSYTANPVACAAAVSALDAYPHAELWQRDGVADLFPENTVAEISRLEASVRVVAKGSLLAVELASEKGPAANAPGYGSGRIPRVERVLARLLEDGVFARPLGRTIYIMGTPTTSAAEGARLASALLSAVAKET